MFCSACGTKITNQNARFCPVCGNRLRQLAEKHAADHSAKQSEVFRGTGKASSENNAGNKARAVSVSGDDHETNASLFELFRQLIEPVKAIELLEDKKVQNIQRVEGLKAKCMHLQEAHGPSLIKILFAPAILDTVDEMRYARDCKEDLEEYSRQYDELVPKVEKENQNYSAQQDQILAAISSYICFVPPDYRTSNCLTIMVNDYNNCRVDNLKEAVLLCDQKQAHAQVMGQLTSIHYDMAATAMRMNDIEDALGTLQQETEFAAAAAMSSAILSAGMLAFI